MTTIVLVRKKNEVVVAGDVQVSMANTIIKSTAKMLAPTNKNCMYLHIFPIFSYSPYGLPGAIQLVESGALRSSAL